ncbi:hypothetical protein BCR41DRAFT_359640 [Lobosporangium transversale]|uniref:Uncharacterized protein n=1 Tax=Lobosporangium transversale TaxID=64571 RepID=A0A1Y2GFB6_9FUNG|nr:hypothetical protein BCR41DRAFT_359640 [Lobosporangium transversale]ORZ08289.1 hypothetical protein BCR41DRAFT_359640 [Lobosporangium transversale]|eukprot:XP_021878372.1 hypothetical protein BCR41DRAFT_359640 [Lobosporangium transversale]
MSNVTFTFILKGVTNGQLAELKSLLNSLKTTSQDSIIHEHEPKQPELLNVDPNDSIITDSLECEQIAPVDINGNQHHFPNGDIDNFTIPSNDKIGWIMPRISHGQNGATYYSCKGDFKCREPGCDYRATPKAKTKPDEQLYCQHHKSSLMNHIVCKARLHSSLVNGQIIYKHKGNHNHDIPIKYKAASNMDSSPKQINLRTDLSVSNHQIVRPEIDTETFGIPWGIASTYKATKTCAVDTTLMAWYLLHHCNGVRIPSHFRNRQVLDTVMGLIGKEQYNLARIIWYSSLNIGPCESKVTNNWIATLDKTFIEQFPELTSTHITTTSTCSSIHCPQKTKSESSVHPIFMIQDPTTISQQTFDESLKKDSYTCDQSIPEKSIKKYCSNPFLHQSIHDIETGETRNWFCCNGKRTEKSVIKKPPCLLVLGNSHSFPKLKRPAQTLSINGANYDLGVIFFADDSKTLRHFSCSVFNRETSYGYYYDGVLKGQVLHNLSKSSILPSVISKKERSSISICQVWYYARDSEERIENEQAYTGKRQYEDPALNTPNKRQQLNLRN